MLGESAEWPGWGWGEVGVAMAWVQHVHFVHPGTGRVSTEDEQPFTVLALTRGLTSPAVTVLALDRYHRCLGGIIKKKGHVASTSQTTPMWDGQM